MARLEAVLSFCPARPKLAGSLRILSILPLTSARVEAHDREMTTDLLLRSASYDGRPWDRLLARLRAPSLDRQLVAGCPPGSTRALAIRARQVVSPAGRRELAQRWGGHRGMSASSRC